VITGINDGLTNRNIFFPNCFHPNESQGKKQQAPELIEKSHGRFKTGKPDTKTEKGKQDNESHQPPESCPDNMESPDGIPDTIFVYCLQNTWTRIRFQLYYF
jgi:hypothetical protein